MEEPLTSIGRALGHPTCGGERLKVFRDAQVETVRLRVGPMRVAPWPELDGCLVVLFTSRSGSTFLARELEGAFDIGLMRESFNPKQIKGHAAADIIKKRRGAWFALKAGMFGVIAGELYGFFDAYLDKTVFILLVRRDIVAQAVSLEKAEQTEQWHSTDAPRRLAQYNSAKIAGAISRIAAGVEQLRLYAERSEQPWRTLIYEDFSGRDFTPALAACDALGAPRRDAGSGFVKQPVERIGDAVNEEWAARFRDEMDPATSERIERYMAAV